jgi:hypothetical protein
MCDLERLIAVDHPDQRTVVRGSGFPRYMRIDKTHDLPIVVTDAAGKIIARFAEPFEAGRFLQGRALSGQCMLPAPIVEALL